MALVENLGSPRKGRDLSTEKRVKVMVDARAVNSSFHGARLREGENVIVIPESLLGELESQVEDLDWGPVIQRYESKVKELCYDRNGDQIRTEQEITYNLSQAFVDQYMREPRRFRKLEVLERDIAPSMSQSEKVTVALLDKLAEVQTGSRRGRAKSASGSTE